MIKTSVIFGGTGFIGIHLTRFLIKEGLFDKIILADINDKLDEKRKFKDIVESIQNNIIEIKKVDIRNKIDKNIFPDNISLIINLSATHREPGHKSIEYFETNIKGAENICNFAKDVNCNNIIFTSSISVYGPTEEPKTELSLTTPETPYGVSKLIAEYIHRLWLESDKNNKLIIVRPGVIYGAGENGNVSRLIKSVKKGYFFYIGNKNTVKAGGYVKELCNTIIYNYRKIINNNEKFILYNFTMNPPQTMKNYVDNILEVLNKKRIILNIPFIFIYFSSYILKFLFKLFNKKSDIDPVRVRKTLRSNNIIPQYLIDNNYNYIYSLKEAFIDWKNEMPEEW